MNYPKLLLKSVLILSVGLIASQSLIVAQTAKIKTSAVKSSRKFERRFGFVESFEQSNDGAWRLQINYAEIFEGAAADRAAKVDKAGYVPSESSGIYVRDQSALIRTLAVSEKAQILLLEEMQPSKVSLVNFAKLMRGETQNLPKYWGFPFNAREDSQLPVYLSLENGVVTKIEQEYFP